MLGNLPRRHSALEGLLTPDPTSSSSSAPVSHLYPGGRGTGHRPRVGDIRSRVAQLPRASEYADIYTRPLCRAPVEGRLERVKAVDLSRGQCRLPAHQQGKQQDKSPSELSQKQGQCFLSEAHSQVTSLHLQQV